MLRLMLLPVSGLVLLAGNAAPPQAPQDPAARPDKKICRMLAPIGTIIPKRYCLTKAEWKQIGDVSEPKNDVYRNRNSFACGKPGTPGACQEQ